MPGASVAARAVAGSGGGTWANMVKGAASGSAVAPSQAGTGAGRTPTGGGGPASSADDDGFQQVTRKGRKVGATVAGDAGAQGSGRSATMDTPNADEGELTLDATEADDGDGDEQPTVADLQQAWHNEVALVRKLRGQGVQDGHPAMRAACEARDAAEHAWRSSKEPAPASVRLGRAQSKLDRAVVLQSEARQAMLDEEREHRERMATLQATMDECTERVAMRRRQLQDVQEEVGAGGTRGVGAQRAQMDAIKRVHGTICEEVGPTLAALAEQVGTETPAWATLNCLLGKLAETKATLENASTQPAAQYHIGDGADQWESWTDWSESHDVQGQHWGQGNSGHTQHTWADGTSHEEAHDESMGTGEWWDTPARRWGATTRWQSNGHGQWSRASWADQLEEEQDGIDEGDGQPPTARRRLEERAEGGAQQSQQQQPQQPQPPASRGPSAGEPSAGAEERQRKHNERVNHIVALAVEAGVTPLTSSGEELLMLDAEQLEAWVAECLPSALLC